MNRRQASLSVLGPALLSACGGGDDPEPASDSLEILSASPSTASPGVSTEFTVNFRYSLTTTQAGVVDLGFFFSATNQRLSGQRLMVRAGTGLGTLKAVADPADYTASTDFAIGILLSEEPHPETWTPLARAKQPITVSK